MKIESQSLAPYIYNLGIQDSENQELEKVWREILKFPDENWSASGDEKTILDPSRVLARMLCVKIDRLVGDWIKRKTNQHYEIPLSWLLRITPDKEWSPGDVLIFVKLRAVGKTFDEDFQEIEKWFPELFEGLSYRGKVPQNNSVSKIEKIITEYHPKISNGNMIHVSVPKFHKIWSHVFEVQVDEEKRQNDDAKRQWSMTVNGIFEQICSKIVREDDANILQSGGGHLLILLPEDRNQKDYAETLLSGISSSFIEENKWCPLIWASWDGGSCNEWSSPKAPSRIVERLKQNYDNTREKRDGSKKQWSIFKDGKSEDFTNSRKRETAIFYLDVINLGDYCWPGKSPDLDDSIDFSQLDPSDWPVPTRTIEEAISGFTKSRKITPVIESTFGQIFAKHHPNSIEAMGGDEIIFTMEASKFTSLLENIEKHTLHLHKTIFDEQQRMLWWAMCSVGEPPESYSDMKSTVRDLTIPKSKTLSRFVNPLWTDFL